MRHWQRALLPQTGSRCKPLRCLFYSMTLYGGANRSLHTVFGQSCGQLWPRLRLNEGNVTLHTAIQSCGIGAHLAPYFHIPHAGLTQAYLDAVDHGFQHRAGGAGVGLGNFQRQPRAHMLKLGLTGRVFKTILRKYIGAYGLGTLKDRIDYSSCAPRALAVKFQPMKKHNILSFRIFAVPAMLVATLFITACAETVNTRGQIILPSRLAQIQPGTSTKQDVLQLLGSPSTQGTMNDNRWYYISSSVGTTSFTPHDLKSRQVVIIDFDANGVVANLTQKGKSDGKEVSPEATATETHGQAMGIIDQFMGNLGGLIKD